MLKQSAAMVAKKLLVDDSLLRGTRALFSALFLSL